MSHVHSPESNPNPPLPVTTTVVPYTTVESMMGRSLIRPAVLRRSTSYLDFTRDMRAEAPTLVTSMPHLPFEQKMPIGA